MVGTAHRGYSVLLLFLLLGNDCSVFLSIIELCAVPRALAPVKKLLLIANSAFNPFVYGFLKHDVKREVKQLLRM